ncbi:MAG: S8 family peptidase [Sinimarinibacterium sp.]|jgi:subtilisin family serine protease
MRYGKGLLCSLGLITAAFSQQSLAAGRPDLVTMGLQQNRPYVSGEMLVQFLPGTAAAQREQALRDRGATRVQSLRNGGELQLVRIPAGMQIAEAMRSLEASAVIAFAEPNWIYTTSAISNDTYYTGGQLWGMYGDATTPANVYGSQAGEAWAAGHTCSGDVYVGVIDEGLMDAHEDLAANAWTNPFDAADGVDNDGNGYVDDVHGWDFDGGNASTFDGTTDDHGTHVSGTIAGAGGNGKGVAGVCWSAKLISGKFLGRRGGTTANAVSAVDYMTDLKTRHGLNVVATNNSWGGGGYSQALADAITRAGNANILFVAAAGNETNDNDANASYPGAYANDNIIAVAALTSTGALASYSNWGASTVDLGAPGSAITSTVPKSAKGKIVSGYASYSGTSMATPHVTGAAALYASTHPGATALQIKAAILGSVVPTASLNGKTATGGRLNVSNF